MRKVSNADYGRIVRILAWCSSLKMDSRQDREFVRKSVLLARKLARNKPKK